jgi:hypothetical protein
MDREGGMHGDNINTYKVEIHERKRKLARHRCTDELRIVLK